ncbi:putative odorant receptor 85d isoform X2 [Temnothorax longispinosus]|uniref:putative odorant receptor 85d isoform X2 n=1 Tax=Temnothorax longispinosus TaxID=300112 RepID=UPI003A990846
MPDRNQSRPRFFVIEIELRLNKDEYFLPIFGYISVLAVVSIMITASVDTMHIACASHACSLFAAVSLYSKVNLLALFPSRRFVDILNSSYQVYALTFLIIVIGTMTAIGLRILYILDQLETVIKFVLILMVSLSSLLITCYSGQRIVDESQNIFYGVYAAEWYKFSPRLKYLLKITLYRSSKPCELKAGNMIPLSLATYATVLQMAWSYYRVLYSMQK